MEHLIKQLQKQYISFKQYPHYAIYFRKRWEDAFVGHLTLAEKENIYLYSDRYFCGYLWHLFSWGKAEHLKGQAARNAFHAEAKSMCYCFYQHAQDVFVIANAQALTAALFAQQEDIYIVDEHFTWTYVVPHGGDIGPYFSKQKARTSL